MNFFFFYFKNLVLFHISEKHLKFWDENEKNKNGIVNLKKSEIRLLSCHISVEKKIS